MAKHITILTEKPSASRNFQKALGGKTGTFEGEKFEIVHARGHLFGYPQEPEKMAGEDYKSWSLNKIPWNPSDFEWKKYQSNGVKNLIDDIKKSADKSSELVIATDDDPSGEGQLIAWEIIDRINYRAIHTYICSLGYDESYENFYKQLKLRIVENDLYDSTTINRKEFHKLLYGKPISDLKLDRKIEQLLIEYLQNDNNHAKALNIISSFKEIITNNSTTLLNDYLNIFNLPEWNDWIKVKEFMKGVERDIIAVNNQINEKITNSTTEGFVSKIKTIKKRTYGRASFAGSLKK